MNSVAVVFTLDELWLLQSLVRHELPQPPEWKFPPASLELNDQIAAAILACTEYNLPDAALALSRGDLLLLDYVVPQSATNVGGKNVGRPILLKSYQARRELDEGPMPAAEDADDTAAFGRLERWKEAGMPKHPRRSHRISKEE